VIKQFIENDQKSDESFIIPPNLFDEPLPFLLIEIPYCEDNENASKRFLNKLHEFTRNKYKIAIRWATRKVKSLFKVKDKNIHPSCVIYKGVCTCKESYIGESLRNVEVRWSEHDNPSNNSEPARHIAINAGHSFTWSVLQHAHKNTKKRKILEAFYIAIEKPKLNEQISSKILNLFRNGIT